jgi:hypothetical protein
LVISYGFLEETLTEFPRAARILNQHHESGAGNPLQAMHDLFFSGADSLLAAYPASEALKSSPHKDNPSGIF